jgi:multimeric flavodoxin WrbA
MKILALNATYRSEGTTTQLTQKALEGAASMGAETEMVLLKDHDIQFCTNCLTCYKDLESEIAPCVIQDDVRGILEKIRDSDGIILASPVHGGFISGLMTVFMERASFTLCRPTGEIMGLKGCPEPRCTDKVRASASIVSAGGIPTELRQYCDLGTPWLKDMAETLFNGEFLGDVYAGAVFTKELEGDEWSKAFFFRELTQEQLQEAYDLGVKLAEAVKSGQVRPYDPARVMAAFSEGNAPSASG